MKYVLIETKNGDMFNKEYENGADALQAAEDDWNALSDADKKNYSDFYVLLSANPDEEAENHFDGNVIKDYKAGNNGYTNIELEWVAPYGPNKGEKVSQWFQYGDSEIDRLKAEFNAVEISRV